VIRFGFITGFLAEARVLQHELDVPLVAVTGAQPGRAEVLASKLVDKGATVLVSFGLAGGLDPELHAGDVVLAHTVVCPNGQALPTDPSWRSHFASAAIRQMVTVRSGRLAGSDTPVASRLAKQTLLDTTGAVAVDMESHRVAQVAARRGVPMLALRVIADTALHVVPPPALAGIGPKGNTRPLAVIGRLLLTPWHLPAMLQLSADTARGLRSLQRVASLFDTVA